jgi:integrase/recombinase XerD
MLSLYRRHSADCHVHKTKLKPKAKRAFLDCDCPLWMFGRTETAMIPRQSCGTRDFAVADAMRTSLLKKGQDQIVHGPTIEDCVERFLTARQHELGDKTAGSYRLLLGRLDAYCATRGVHHTQNLTVDLLEDFKVAGLPELKDTTKGNAVAKLRCFLKTAFRRGWTLTPLAEKVTPFNAIYEQKEPYTPAEVASILEEASKLNGGRDGYAGAPATFRLLLELMLETGMRVSDAIRFDPSALQKGESLWIYPYTQTKRKRTARIEVVEVYLSERLKGAIDGCRWLSPELPFWFGSKTNKYGLAYQVYDRMQTLGERCGVNDCRPHRLRDTFAVNALLRGLGIGDVSRLLGHSSVKITEAYYAKWVPARKRRLESLVAQSLVNT